MNERDAWIALASTAGVGDLTFSRLLEVHGSAAATMEALSKLPSRRADRAVANMVRMRLRPGLGRAIVRSAEDPHRIVRVVTAIGGWILTPLDDAYPPALLAIEEPPPLLYGLGDGASSRANPSWPWSAPGARPRSGATWRLASVSAWRRPR